MPAKIYHHDLYGKREEKYEFLKNNSVSTTNWTELQPDEKYHFFVPKNFDQQVEWEKGIKVSELFGVFNSGVETQKDSITIHFEKITLNQIKKDFSELESKQILDKYTITESRDWKVNLAREDLKNTETIKINYRPFDHRWTEYSGRSKGFMAYPRHDTSKHFLHENLGLIAKRGLDEENSVPGFISNSIIDRRAWSRPGMQGAESLIPLYLYPDIAKSEGDIFEETKLHNYEGILKQVQNDNSPVARPNFKAEVTALIEEKLGMKLSWDAPLGVSFHPDKSSLNKVLKKEELNVTANRELKFSATDLLDYIYAVLHSSVYREKYKEFLKIDFPRIPFGSDWLKIAKTPRQPAVATPQEGNLEFWRLVQIGSKLRKLHLIEGIGMEKLTVGYSVSGDNVVESVRWDAGFHPVSFAGTPQEGNFGRVWINEKQYFNNVPEVAWNFYIGGYQPAQKWLKDRKGRELSFDDIIHFQKIIYILETTNEIMKQIG